MIEREYVCSLLWPAIVCCWRQLLFDASLFFRCRRPYATIWGKSFRFVSLILKKKKKNQLMITIDGFALVFMPNADRHYRFASGNYFFRCKICSTCVPYPYVYILNIHYSMIPSLSVYVCICEYIQPTVHVSYQRHIEMGRLQWCKSMPAYNLHTARYLLEIADEFWFKSIHYYCYTHDAHCIDSTTVTQFSVRSSPLWAIQWNEKKRFRN